MDFCRNRQQNHSLLSNGSEVVERVSNFKYLELNVTEDLSWSINTFSAVGKAQQGLYYLKKLRSAHILLMVNFHNCAISSVLTYVLYFSCGFPAALRLIRRRLSGW